MVSGTCALPAVNFIRLLLYVVAPELGIELVVQSIKNDQGHDRSGVYVGCRKKMA
jgi:hypothetical protein